MTMQRTRFGAGRRMALGRVLLVVTVALVLTSPQPAFATTSGARPDPAWDFGRGGAEVPGQPECYLPAPNVTERKMYSMMRPSCFPGHTQ